MYEQSIDRVKVVVLPLDGTILDLNRYRFNYYHHLCESKHLSLDKHVFYSHLSNMYDMYRGLPLSNEVDSGPFNNKIERELYQYLSYKGLKPKEGCLELIEYLHQKNIYIAVISTHRTKDAVQYLQDVSLYDKVHFIIGSDTTSMPLPSTQMLETITRHFGIQNEEALVISSFMALNYAANELHMNVIYCEDLVKADMREKETSYKTVSSLFEVLNTFLFDRYEEVEMYSPILGMNSTMSKEELDTVKAKLEVTYQNDPQILDLVHRTYMFHISQLGRQNIKDASVAPRVQNVQSRDRFQFEDELTAKKLQSLNSNFSSENEHVSQKEPTHEETTKEKRIIEELYDLTPEPTTFIKEKKIEEPKQKKFFKDNLFKKENKKEEQLSKSTSAIKEENVQDLISVLNQIDNQTQSDDTFLQQVNSKVAYNIESPDVVRAQEEVEERTSAFDIRRQIFDDDDVEEYRDKMEEDSLIMGALIQVSSILALSFMLLFVGIVLYVALIHQFRSGKGIFALIGFVFQFYFQIIETVIGFVFNSLNYFIPMVPSYDTFLNHNIVFSHDGVQLFNIFVFQCFLILIVKGIFYIVKRRINEKIYS